MKRYLFLTLFATIFCYVSMTFATFFIPAKELEPHYEKLPPIPNPAAYNARQTPTPDNRIKRYIPVDGRFIPVVEDAPAEADLTAQETPAAEPVAETAQATEPQITPDAPAKEDIFYAAMPPRTDPINLSLPSYKNRYAQYLASLQAFQSTGVLEPNPELDATLSRLNSNEYVVVFKQKLK